MIVYSNPNVDYAIVYYYFREHIFLTKLYGMSDNAIGMGITSVSGYASCAASSVRVQTFHKGVVVLVEKFDKNTAFAFYPTKRTLRIKAAPVCTPNFEQAAKLTFRGDRAELTDRFKTVQDFINTQNTVVTLVAVIEHGL